MMIKTYMILILFISSFDILIGAIIDDWVVSLFGIIGLFQYILIGLELDYKGKQNDNR